MSRQYKARDKKFHKMTRGGLVERNAVTGAEENISKREQDFNLRTEQPDSQNMTAAKARTENVNTQPRQSEPVRKHRQTQNFQARQRTAEAKQDAQNSTGDISPPVSGTTEAVKYKPEIDRRTDNTAVPPQREAAIPDKPTEAVKPSERPHKTRNYESPAVTPPGKDGGSVPQEYPPNAAKPPPKAERPRRLRFSEETTAISGEVKPETPLNTTQSDKLQFTKNSNFNQSKKSGKNQRNKKKPQKGNKYQQRFTPEAAQHEKPPVLEYRQSEQTVQQAQPDEKPEVINNTAPEALSVPDVPPRSQSGKHGKLQFAKDKVLNQSGKDGKARKKSNKYQQRFTPEAEKPQPQSVSGEAITKSTPAHESKQADTAPVSKNTKTDKTPDAVPDKSRLRTDVKPSKLQEKPGKLKFNADVQDKGGLKPPRKNKSRRRVDEKPAESNPVSEDVQPKPDKPEQKKSDIGKTPSDNASETAKNPDKSSKLTFTDDEKSAAADKKLSQLQDKADKYNAKLEKARDKLPSKKRSKEVRSFDESKGKAKSKFQFEKEILPPGTRKTSIPVEVAKTGADEIKRSAAGKLHQKIYEVEHENVGIQAGHRVEQAAESVYRGGKRVTRSAFRYVKNRPYRTVEKLEKQAVKANIRLSYRKALSENPQLKSNVLSRFMQKRKIKQQYAKAARDAKRAGKAAKKTGDMTVGAVKAVAGAIKSHPAAAVVILIILLLVFFIASLFSSFGGLAGTGFPAIMATSYLAGDSELDTAELSYTEWETDLLMKIDKTEQDYPGYDEYRYQVDNIGHNPYELIAYLTAAYQDFQYTDIESVLRQIFDEQYSLTVTPSVEIRYADPTDANEDGDYEPYDWHVLTVSLTSRSFTDVILPRMDAEQISIYSLLMQTKGNRQYVDSPFDFNWLPNVTSYYGYRIHPTTGVKDYHKGIDIAAPVGTDIRAGHDGKVTFAGYSGDYGYVLVIEDNKGLVSKYAHCDSLLVSAGQEVKRGDVIAKSGNSGNSTGPHLHLEVIKNGQYLNPLYFAVTNDSSLSSPVYGYAPSPMGDGTYAALIAEAERHLGKPYVYASNGPNSFDCSSYICYILTQSGVTNMPRTSAQGIYNQCTPIPESERQPGDLVFFHSTYSTPNTVTHVGLYVGDGWIIHAGSPIQYTRIDGNAYWQAHLYSYGRIN